MIKILLLILLILPNLANSTEIIAYEVEKKFNNQVELRIYNKILLAQISLAESSRNNAFRSLFKYISGANDKNQKIAMTSPVLVTNSDVENSFSFILPSKFAWQDIPKSLDKKIKFKALQDRKFVAIRFSGRATDKNFAKYQEILTKIIIKNNLQVTLKRPIYAYYNPPWTLFFLKRNEVLFELQ